MHTARLTVDEALAGLRTARDGLATREAERRAAEYGPNRVEEARREPAALRLARQFTHFFALILWVAAGLAFSAEAFEPGQGMATLGAAIVGVIAVNGAFAFWQEARAERTVAALRALLPNQVTVLRDGAALAAYFFVLDAGGWRYGEALAARDPLYLQATTACLAAIVVMQVANVFLCRDPVRSAFSFGLASNPLILWGIAFGLALIAAIVYTPWGQELFGTAALPLEVWLYVLPFAAAMFALEEGRKLLRRAFL